MIRPLLALALAMAPAALPNFAIAQSCAPKPGPQLCVNRFPPGQVIDKRTGGPSGTVSCKAQQANKVQYDVYLQSGAGYLYHCSQVLTCAQVQSFDTPAFNKFC